MQGVIAWAKETNPAVVLRRETFVKVCCYVELFRWLSHVMSNAPVQRRPLEPVVGPLTRRCDQTSGTDKSRLEFDLSGSPGLVEPRLQRTVEAQDHEPALPGIVCTQFFSMPGGALGPNQTSTEPSALVLKPLSWLLTLGACWSVCSIERVWLS